MTHHRHHVDAGASKVMTVGGLSRSHRLGLMAALTCMVLAGCTSSFQPGLHPVGSVENRCGGRTTASLVASPTNGTGDQVIGVIATADSEKDGCVVNVAVTSHIRPGAQSDIVRFIGSMLGAAASGATAGAAAGAVQ